MKKILLLFSLLLSLRIGAQQTQETWKGRLHAGPAVLTIQLHIDKAHQTVSMDVIEQGAKRLPMTVDVLTDDSISVSMAMPALRYTGRMTPDSIRGRFSQGSFSAPLHMQRGATTFHRPQEPRPPYPYTTQEVSFTNAAAHATLAGTLTLPTGYRPGDRVPVLLMVTGSGPQDRDEQLFEHRPFLVIADYLARHGIASLRYDDRGTGRSTGRFATATTRDLADDATAGIAFLRQQKMFSKVGLLGHSEGGSIGYMLAADGLTDFLVSMAGPAGRIDTMMVLQINALNRLHQTQADSIGSVEEVRQLLLQTFSGPWIRYFIDMDLTPFVRRTTCPVLALGGDRDPNVPVDFNVPVLEQNLPKGKYNKVKTYEGLSHMMHHNPTGNTMQSMYVEETVAPEVLSDIVTWIKGLP